MTTYFFDPISGNNANDGLTFANRKQTITSFTPAAGDLLKVIANPLPTSTSINATFTNASPTLTLASALTQNISTCDAIWTAGTVNVTPSVDSTAGNFKEGTGAAKLIFAAGFTTGLAAYFPTGTLDLSAYGGISFWFQPNSVTGGLAFSSWQIKLCSDTAGVTAVNTFNLPAALNGGAWHQITIDNGGALDSSIKSVALYATADPGSATVRIDNVLAVKAVGSADSLNLRSLVGKNNGTTGEAWYSLQSINGTTVILGGTVTLTSGSSNLRGYSGTTETVTLYKQEPMYMTDNASQTQSSFCDVNASGTAASHITISGGWDRTNMSTQVGTSFIAQYSSSNIGLRATSRSFVDVVNMGWVEFFQGALLTTCDNFTFTNCHAISNFGIGIGPTSNGGNNTYTNCILNNNGNYGLTPGQADKGTGIYCYGNATANILYGNGGNNVFTTVSALNSTNVGIDYSVSSDNLIFGLTTGNNGVAALRNYWGNNYISTATLPESVEFVAGANFGQGRLSIGNADGSTDDNRTYSDGALIQSETANAENDGLAWRIDITSANRLANYPMSLAGYMIGQGLRAYCIANNAVTIQARAMKNNANMVATLLVKGGQIAGVANDVSASVSGVNAYETLTLNFTPTASGWVDMQFIAYTTDGATTYSAYLDRFLDV